MTDPQHFWGIRLTVEAAAADAFEAALADIALSVARFEADAGEGAAGPGGPKLWRLQATCRAEPDIAELALRLAVAAGRAGAALPDFHIEKLPDVDWLALNRSQFPPIAAGRFFIHGSHFDGKPPDGRVAIRLDAGPAFGSGTHETTRGCLLALDSLLTEEEVRHPLDLGCGSGILALAIAKAAGVAVTASDIDEIAAETTLANACANGVGHLVTAFAEEGVGKRVRAGAPYDLICANILAEPLIVLAADVATILAPGGRLILSGLLARQQGEVVAAYGAQGLERIRTIVLGDWSTLVLIGNYRRARPSGETAKSK